MDPNFYFRSKFTMAVMNVCLHKAENEVLNIDFGPGAAKISDVKVVGRKNICPLSLV